MSLAALIRIAVAGPGITVNIKRNIFTAFYFSELFELAKLAKKKVAKNSGFTVIFCSHYAYDNKRHIKAILHTFSGSTGKSGFSSVLLYSASVRHTGLCS